MKNINIRLTEAEFKKMNKAKRLFAVLCNTSLTWEKFIVMKCTKGVSARRAPNGS